MAAAPADAGAAVLVFPYHRGIAPTLGVLLALAVVETVVLHIVAMALWGRGVALALGLLDLSAVALLIALLRSLRRRPVTIADGCLTLRLGFLKTIRVPLAQVAGLRTDWDAQTLRQRDVLNLALASWPNVMVALSVPVRMRRRWVGAIAHKLDDPAAFASALDRLAAARRS
jgi:hypothetical protein